MPDIDPSLPSITLIDGTVVQGDTEAELADAQDQAVTDSRFYLDDGELSKAGLALADKQVP